ncbi:ANTAR domain-containing protein [Streptomyces sp. T-3]|nr:ANTAR domain-containing protein [Streptomyces sp. T-3]
MSEIAQSRAGQDSSCIELAASTDRHLLSGLTLFRRADGDRVAVRVAGELNLAANDQLLDALRSFTSETDEGVGLRLSGVEFCGCSAVNILLTATQQVLHQPTAPAVGNTGPEGETMPAPLQTRRLTATLYDAPAAQSDDAGTATSGPHDPDADLRAELMQLRRAMQSRGTIDVARGILVATFRISPDDAWSVLVDTSQHANIKLHRVAEHLLDSALGAPLPEIVQEPLSAAVAQYT